MERKTYWVVKLPMTSSYLVSIDEDGRETIPLYATRREATESARRSDLDDWEILPVQLP